MQLPYETQTPSPIHLRTPLVLYSNSRKFIGFYILAVTVLAAASSGKSERVHGAYARTVYLSQESGVTCESFMKKNLHL